MFRSVLASACAVCLAVTGAQAEERTRLGYGRLVTNDFFGDGKDRWRTGSITSSRIWGRRAPEGARGFGDLIELRLGAEIMAPGHLGGRPDPTDRPYAGTLSVGAHTHFAWHGFEMSTGADLVFVGPATGLGSFQREMHDLLGMPRPSEAQLDAQIENAVRPTVVVEMGRSFAFGDRITLRPFVEARVGAETLLRAGADLTLGRVGQGELLIRETATGQRYRTVQAADPGFSLVLGGDMAVVEDSVYLPEDRGYDLTDSRDRVRAGVHWQGESASAFYGLTWLGEEFRTQGSDQIVGSVRINLQF
ncbi:lipid A-modifier LpxR family protein [Sulfitobacter sabulilitoris]|uniref:Lipid A deacylase LpxR family protein n=1 Tax=Sulfitobacter sabulilitoris TaxID=2562655 RepID=A0A5S3PCI9_9RHOB|nr:lipid A deacylase LpxR family protein [Sulfitobacter sabulilitoris]